MDVRTEELEDFEKERLWRWRERSIGVPGASSLSLSGEGAGVSHKVPSVTKLKGQKITRNSEG